MRAVSIIERRLPLVAVCSSVEPFTTPLHAKPDLSYDVHVSFLLFDNIWNTNYPDWLPFNGKTDLLYRFGIEW